MSKSKKINTPTLINIGLITTIIIAFFLWNSYALFPVKLFVVLLHEISHGIAAVLTGGSIKAINISIKLGGHCITRGGNEFIVASAGYLGSLILGSTLFISSYDFKLSKIVCTIFAGSFVVITASFISSNLGIIFTLLISAFLIISPRFFKPVIHTFLIRLIGILSSFYVFVDIKDDLLLKTTRITDATSLEIATNIPSIYWGLIWITITGIVIFYLIKYGIKNKNRT